MPRTSSVRHGIKAAHYGERIRAGFLSRGKLRAYLYAGARRGSDENAEVVAAASKGDPGGFVDNC